MTRLSFLQTRMTQHWSHLNLTDPSPVQWDRDTDWSNTIKEWEDTAQGTPAAAARIAGAAGAPCHLYTTVTRHSTSLTLESSSVILTDLLPNLQVLIHHCADCASWSHDLWTASEWFIIKQKCVSRKDRNGWLWILIWSCNNYINFTPQSPHCVSDCWPWSVEFYLRIKL